MPRVRVIVVNYNAGAYLRECLDGLAAQTLSDFECVVVDNGSTDGSPGDAVPDDSRFRVLFMGRNAGFAAGNNVGAREAATPWLALLNPDAIPAPDWLESLIAATRRYPQAVMLGSTQYMLDAPDRYDGVGDSLLAFGFPWRGGYRRTATGMPPTGEVFAPCAAAAMYRRDAFEAVGGFDESFFCYAEDVDLAYRMRLRGGRCLQVGAARVRHAGSGVSGRHSAFAAYHGIRNQTWILIRNTPGPLLPVVAPGFVVLAVGFVFSALRHGLARAVLAGLRDGALGVPGAWRGRRLIERRVGTRAIARALSWNPVALLRRDMQVRDWTHHG